jgi:VWFA-related protein
MRLTKPALTSLLLAVTTLGAPHLDSEMRASDQPPQPTTAAAPTLKVYSRETIVDVTVSDSKGNPVHGLTQADFTVNEDGNPQPIRSFAEFGPPSQSPTSRRLPPNVYTNFQATPATGPVNILLIDAMHCHPVDVVHTLRGAERYLVAMPSGTQVAIFWLAASGLHMLQGLTSDPALLLRAVRTNRIDFGTNGSDRYTIDKITLNELDQIAAYVQPIEGRKNLLWFAPGAPILLLRDGGYAWGDGEMTRVHRIMDTYEIFAAEQIAVFPIDPRGVTRLGMAQLAAEAIAEGTGGEAFYENNDLKPQIGKAIHDGSSFYTLSYIPPRPKNDGHYHTIKVQTSVPGVHLVYRVGYNSEDPPQLPQHSGTDLLKAAMQGNAPAATQLVFDVQVAPGTGTSASSTLQPAAQRIKARTSVPYDILFSIPQQQIALATTPDGVHTGALDFHVASFDIYGRPIASSSETVDIPLSADQLRDFMKAPFQFCQQLNLPPGQISLRVGILDTTSNKVGTLEIPLVVPNPSGQHGSAPPPTVPTPCPPRCALPTPPPAP